MLMLGIKAIHHDIDVRDLCLSLDPALSSKVYQARMDETTAVMATHCSTDADSVLMAGWRTLTTAEATGVEDPSFQTMWQLCHLLALVALFEKIGVAVDVFAGISKGVLQAMALAGQVSLDTACALASRSNYYHKLTQEAMFQRMPGAVPYIFPCMNMTHAQATAFAAKLSETTKDPVVLQGMGMTAEAPGAFSLFEHDIDAAATAAQKHFGAQIPRRFCVPQFANQEKWNMRTWFPFHRPENRVHADDLATWVESLDCAPVAGAHPVLTSVSGLGAVTTGLTADIVMEDMAAGTDAFEMYSLLRGYEKDVIFSLVQTELGKIRDTHAEMGLTEISLHVDGSGGMGVRTFYAGGAIDWVAYFEYGARAVSHTVVTW